MSSYNGESFIREQINSILAQKGEFQLDLWVRDDGSNDRTRQILGEYADAGMLRWYTGENLRPARSFMDLMCCCNHYDYYAFADQDDYWMPDKINSGIQMLRKTSGPALYCANAELVDSSLQSLGRNVYRNSPKTDFKTLTCAGGLLGCTMVFNDKLRDIVCTGKIPDNIVMHDFYIALICTAINGKILFDPKPHMKYRQHGNNVIGVPRNCLETVRSRIHDILHKETVGISVQAETVLKNFAAVISDENKAWLQLVSEYRQSVFRRINLAHSGQMKFVSMNMGMKIRLSILLGNR